MKDYDSDDIPPDLIPKYGAGIISGPLVFLVQAPLHQYMGVFFICCGGLTICVVSYLATTPRYRKKFAQEIQGKETVYNYDAIFRIASSFTVIAVTTALFSVGFRDSHSISHYVGAYLGGIFIICFRLFGHTLHAYHRYRSIS